MSRARKVDAAACPCGSGRPLDLCCGALHTGAAAPDAERLMRARYAAYALGRTDYLLRTWHTDTRPLAAELETSPRPKWIGLSVKSHRVCGVDSATVEFVARYKLNGRAFMLHETSRFARVAGQWYYVDGEIPD